MNLEATYLWHCKRCDLRALMPREGGSLGCKELRADTAETCPATGADYDIYEVVDAGFLSDAAAELEFLSTAADLERK